MAIGDTNLFFNRDTKVYAVQATAFGAATYNVWELPVLNGYSFSQSTNSSQVTLKEMANATGNSRRGQVAFNDSLAPAEWSFDMYARPTLATVVRAPEEILWHSLFSETIFNPAAGQTTGISITSWAFSTTTITLTVASHPFTVGDTITVSGLTATTNAPNGTFTVTGVTTTTVTYTAPAAPTGTPAGTGILTTGTFATSATQMDFFAAASNKTKLATFDLYFVLGANKFISGGGVNGNYTADEKTTIYKVAGCCVNEATVNFDIDGITTVNWSGMGLTITEIASINFTGAPYTLIQNGVNSTTNMIRNRLTAATVNGIVPTSKTYSLTLTGGSITISNNINFLTPETLGVVNQPLGHVVGTRSVSGTFTCYMDELTNGSIDLYQDMLSATSTITNKFLIQFFVGGKNAAGTGPVSPGIMFDMGQCHLEVPSVNIDDVIAMEVNFTALPSTISATDELTKIRYVA